MIGGDKLGAGGEFGLGERGEGGDGGGRVGRGGGDGAGGRGGRGGRGGGDGGGGGEGQSGRTVNCNRNFGRSDTHLTLPPVGRLPQMPGEDACGRITTILSAGTTLDQLAGTATFSRLLSI